MTGVKCFWDVDGHSPSFLNDFNKLPAGEVRWKVLYHIGLMAKEKDIMKLHHFTKCEDVRQDIYLFAIGNDGFGNMQFELQIQIDQQHHIITPISVRPIRND